MRIERGTGLSGLRLKPGLRAEVASLLGEEILLRPGIAGRAQGPVVAGDLRHVAQVALDHRELGRVRFVRAVDPRPDAGVLGVVVAAQVELERARRLQGKDCEIRCGHKVTELLTEGGRVAGVSAEGPVGLAAFRARRGVVLTAA